MRSAYGAAGTRASSGDIQRQTPGVRMYDCGITHVESTPLGATMELSKSPGQHQGAALMKRTTKYVGLDVHQATTVASVRDRSGRVIARAILPTENAALTDFFQGMSGAVNVAFEEGTQAQWLRDLLTPLAHSVTVCNLRGQPRRPGNKADVKDADSVSRQLLNGDLRAVYHDGANRALLYDYARAYLNAVEDTTRAMLRLKALYRARAIPVAGEQVYSAEHRAEWLSRLR